MQSPPMPAKQRIESIDILRGIVMIIMALDHVRDFFHPAAFSDDPTNMATTTPALFFTRWITHFCAPVFVFLSGTSAFLTSQKKSKKELSIFLIKRGFWLVLIELTVITLGWTFNPLYNIFLLQVIWAIGWSMIILGLLVRTSIKVIVFIGVVIVFGHNMLDYVSLPTTGFSSVLWQGLLTNDGIHINPIGNDRFIVLIYAILPWTGVMLLGYSFGYFYRNGVTQVERKKYLLIAGVSITALFIVLRLINSYGDPHPWSQQKDATFTLLSFLNTTKYPCSLMYITMTLGPAILLLIPLEKMSNKLSGILLVYGRVPFLYYVLHFYLIHTICVVLFFATGHGVSEIVDRKTPFLFRPYTFGFDLWIIYLIWLFVVVVLYFPCKRFQKYKSTHHQWWLSYV